MLTEAERWAILRDKRKQMEPLVRELELIVGIGKHLMAEIDKLMPIPRYPETEQAEIEPPEGRCSETEKAVMIELHRQGLSANQIAARLARTYRTVENILRKANCLRRVYQ